MAEAASAPVGCDPGRASRIEGGREEVGWVTLMRLCQALQSWLPLASHDLG